MLKWILLLALIASPLQAAPLNTYSAPTCSTDVSKLPIYKLTAKYSQDSEGEFNSTIVLIRKNLWRTTAHSVDKNENAYVTIEIPSRGKIIGEVLLVDIKHDVAYIKADSTGLTPIPAISKPLIENEPVWTVGYPGLFDRRLMSFEGMYARTEEKKNRIITSSFSTYGMSGGPALRCVGSQVEMIGTIIELKRSLLSSSTWIEDDIVHNKKIYINAGYSVITPRLQ